jgi:SAM-dependent methyltransferase
MSQSWRTKLREMPVVGDALSRMSQEARNLLELRDRLEQLHRNQAELALALARQQAPAPSAAPEAPLTSCLCTQARCESPAYARWCGILGETAAFHRKKWEFVHICQALEERGVLRAGARGLGFGVGREPLVAHFASRGCHVVATDLGGEEARAAGWERGDQYATSLDALNDRGLCAWPEFRERVRYRAVDMNAIPDDLTGFDFCWSACAFEHVGSIAQGLAFVENSLRTLKPGGIAVHTTEFNLSSNDDTVETGHTVLFRRRDMEALVDGLRAKGHHVEPLDLDPGTGVLDRYVDVPPFLAEPHLRLRLERYNCTSIGLIIRAGG